MSDNQILKEEADHNKNIKYEENDFTHRFLINDSSNLSKSNEIITSKYSLLTAIPQILFEQFKNIINLYFIIIAILQSIQNISITDGKPIILIPLSCVIFLNGLKDFVEDLKRRKNDEEQNYQKSLVLNLNTKLFELKDWKDIKVGEIIKIHDNEYFPTDLILLNSYRSKNDYESQVDVEFGQKRGSCNIETKNIDGESNLKYKFAIEALSSKVLKEENYLDLTNKYQIKCIEPNDEIYEFSGVIYEKDENGNFSKEQQYKLNPENFLCRGSSLKETYCAYGLSVYIGHDTKIMKNSPKIKFKTSKIESIMNVQIIIIFIFDVSISALGGLVYILEMLDPNIYVSLLGKSGFSEYGKPPVSASGYFITFGNCILIFTNLVPISLLVTINIIRYIQGWFISWDMVMCDRTKYLPTRVHSSSLNEELGQIGLIFSDKTGTITKNNMTFKKMSCNGISYGQDKNEKIEMKGITNFNLIDHNLKENLREDNEQYQHLRNFFICLCVCNTVMIDESGQFNVTSPDELAFVMAAKYFNFILKERLNVNENDFEAKGKVVVSVNGLDEEYIFLDFLEFTSDRKCMSAIVKCPDGRIRIYSKGADSVLMEKCYKDSNDDEDKELKKLMKNTNEHIFQYAESGLRTLVLGYKEISLEDWKNSKNFTNLKEKSDYFEKNLNLIGCTGVEDELQENADSTLDFILNAGIKVWMCTGDKPETAKSIGLSCKLLSLSFEVLFFERKDMNEKEIFLKISEFKRKITLSPTKKYGLIVIGEVLSIILNNIELSNIFYDLAFSCTSVLFCRVSPKQKGKIVEMVSKCNPSLATLAIGDGSNDVNMICQASVGIGILGNEGSQAAQSADFAISRFHFLKRLLFYHGREAYRRNSFVVCFNFYKNILLVMPLFWFGFFSLFSGQILYDKYLYQLFNVLFTSLPIVWYGVYDRDLDDTEKLMKNETYYEPGLKGKLFNTKRFWIWVLYATIQGCMICILTIFSNITPLPSGKTLDLFAIGSIVYAEIVIIANLKLITSSNSHSSFSFFFNALSYTFYFLCMVAFSYFPVFQIFNNNVMLGEGCDFYLTIFQMVIFCVSMDIGISQVRIYFGIDIEESYLPKKREKIKEAPMKHLDMEMKKNLLGSNFAQDEGQCPYLFTKKA